MFLLKWIFLLFVICLPAWSIEESIPLSVGLDSDFSLDPAWRGKILKFEGTYTKRTRLFHNKQKHTLRFTPIRKGVGSLIIKEGRSILKKYTVSVRETDLTRVAHEIASLLGEINGITISIINNKVVVDGEIFVPRDMKRIYNVVKEYGDKATSLVTLSASAQNKVAQFIEREIGNPNITVKAANEKFILRGTVSTKEERENANIIAQLYAPGVITDPAVQSGAVRDRNVKNVIINLIKVQPPPEKKKAQNKLVHMVIHYVELSKDYSDQFRFQWAPGMASADYTIGEKIGKVITGTISNLLPKLNWAKEFGFARILHSSNLIVEEGEQGSVSSNKEIPYGVLSGAAGMQVQKANVGVQLSIKPNIVGVRKDGVRLEVQFTVSNMVGVVSSGPVISKREIKTLVYVRSGLSAAIGGVISHTNTRNFNREPGGNLEGGADPVFNLLSSKNFTRERSQFVVFVTPFIKSSASTDVEEIKRKFRIEGH